MELWSTTNKKPVPASKNFLLLSVEGEDAETDAELEIPDVHFRFRPVA